MTTKRAAELSRRAAAVADSTVIMALPWEERFAFEDTFTNPTGSVPDDMLAILRRAESDAQKHLAGQHDQKRHGWRYGSGVSLSTLRRQRARSESEWEEYKRRARGGDRRGGATPKEPEPNVKKFRTRQEFKNAIETHAIVKEHNLKDGISAAVLFEFEDGTKAVWKPWDAAGMDNTSLNEIAASKLSEELGWNLVPPTVKYKGGTVQEFVEGDIPTANLTHRAVTGDAGKRAAVLDAITAQVDRKSANWLVSKDGRPILIDNGLTLHNFDFYKESSLFVQQWGGANAGDAIIRDLRRITTKTLIDAFPLSMETRSYGKRIKQYQAVQRAISYIITTGTIPTLTEVGESVDLD